MDTAGGCASAAAHRAVDPAAAAPMGAKKRPHMSDGWTGTKKMNTTTQCSREYQVHGLESGEDNSMAVVRSRKRSYEYDELELDLASSAEKMLKCNYWEDPAYAKILQKSGLKFARSAALDNECSRLSKEHAAWMAGDAATPSD